LLVAAVLATASADEARIETVVVTAKPIRASVSTFAVGKMSPPASIIEIVAPMPTDMPEAEVDYHLPLIGVAPVASAERAPS
jgi:hypothetical protein